MKPKHPIPEEFAYCLARTNRFRDFAISNMTGTSGRQRVQANIIAGYQMSIPDTTNISELFGTITKPIFEYARNAAKQIAKLSELRDALLPKLLSGEIRVENFNTPDS